MPHHEVRNQEASAATTATAGNRLKRNSRVGADWQLHSEDVLELDLAADVFRPKGGQIPINIEAADCSRISNRQTI